ncbi:MAG: hypothetical protein M1133_13450, partial [Armatimonadetes bacterium]|nr:hypothetical protein [Armatimonadota bacterium]
ITLQNPKATNKVVVTPQTEYRSHGYKGTLADLMIGFHAGASGDAGDGVFTAKVIELVPALAEGAVTAIQGDVITVKTVRQLTLNLQGRPGTAVLIRPRVGPNVKGTSADIKVGMPVNVGFIPNKGGNSRLLWIDLLTGM